MRKNFYMPRGKFYSAVAQGFAAVGRWPVGAPARISFALSCTGYAPVPAALVS